MNELLLASISLIKELPGAGTSYDVAVWPFYAVGGVVIIVIGAIIAGIIIFAVKLLKRIRSKNTPQ